MQFFRRDLRVWNRFIQTLLLQRHQEHIQDMANGDRVPVHVVRMHQMARLPVAVFAAALFHGPAVHHVHLLALLFLVDLYKLLQRRLLLAVELSTIFYSNTILSPTI